MKKIIAALSAAMVLATGSSLGAFADDYPNSYVQKFKDGIFITDTNKDGKFDKADADYILDYYAACQTHYDVSETYSSEEQNYINENCDYNNDKAVDHVDASILLTYWTHYYLPENYTIGDTNLDGAVDAMDASNILEYYALASTSFTDEYSRSLMTTIEGLGDVNNDGAINALDASLILSAYADAQTK